MGEVQVAVAIGGEAAGVGQDREGGEEFALGAEALDAGVVEVGDADRAVPVDDDPDGEVELAVRLPASSPLPQETDRRGLVAEDLRRRSRDE